MDAAIAALVAAAQQANVKRERAESSSDDEPPQPKKRAKPGPKPKQRGGDTKYNFRQQKPALPASTNLSIEITVDLGEATLEFLKKVFEKETPAVNEE